MKDPDPPREKRVSLGRCGDVTLRLSPDRRRLVVVFEIQPDGFDKTGVNGLIDALTKAREEMER